MEANKSYAYLPEDLLLKILEGTPKTADDLSSFLVSDDALVQSAKNALKENGLILNLSNDKSFEEIIAADGAMIVEKMAGADLLMAIAVGVEGLPSNKSGEWVGKGEQYYQWQAALPHHVANTRLAQGIMFLMELSILAKSEHAVRILDGSHITAILKLNSLLSAYDEEFADEEYVNALNRFLNENYNKVIPDIPDIIDEAFSDNGIIALAKYSSSRDILDSSFLDKIDIPGDDKSFFSLILEKGEFTFPMPVGQSKREFRQWKDIHISCNLPLNISEQEKSEFNLRLKKSIEPFKAANDKKSKLYFSYFKPFQDGLAYRVEIKEELANDLAEYEKYLNTIKNQIFFPEIQEPYPQYLADIIAKNIAFGMDALKQAVRSNPSLTGAKYFNLLHSYRSK